ncbi:DUF5134 domain-containing protein [Nocardia sp. NPDC088792]|uniref:DUF5134 domain-containing protein n=1 Tax=Nocardia sp. NPDC088792 TaxID=3364332 RepID=UPI00380B6D39
MVFVQEYGLLRWCVVAAFGAVAVIMVGRLAAVGQSRVAVGHDRVALAGDSRVTVAGHGRAVDVESDAAHLLMCLVMLAMLVFPAAADPRALHGVLTAMVVVYGVLLAGRMLQWRGLLRWPGGEDAAEQAPGRHRVAALAYHLVAAAAMLYVVSGSGAQQDSHAMAGMGAMPGMGERAVWPLLALAALFAADALAMLIPRARRLLWHLLPHPAGRAGSAAVAPHLVMDVGMTYMLIAMVAG